MKRHRSYSRSKTAIRSFGKCLQNKSESGCKLLGFNIAEANYWDPRRLGLWLLSPLPQVRCFHIMSLCHAFQLHVHWKKKTFRQIESQQTCSSLRDEPPLRILPTWSQTSAQYNNHYTCKPCKLKLMKNREKLKLKRQLLTTVPQHFELQSGKIFCATTFRNQLLMQNCNQVESDCVCSQISRTFEDNFTRLRFGWKLRKVEVVNWCLLSNQRDK